MPTIPIYSSSPINASKASGITPQTAAPEDRRGPPYPNQQASVSAATTTSANPPYPPPQPGARPSAPAPAPTGTAQLYSAVPLQPTPTTDVGEVSPPPPQPGAVPLPPGSMAAPRTSPAGIRHQPQPPQQTAAPPAPQAPNVPHPAQMGISPPTMSHSARQSTSTTFTPQSTGPRPAQVGSSFGDNNLSHPPGYQQNVNAGQFNSHQRAAHDASIASAAHQGGDSSQDGEEGVWETAKKWAKAAGDSLAAAESEVWRKINKE